MSDCKDCFKTVRANAEQYSKIQDDAKKYSQEQNQKVAITYAEGDGYSFSIITTKLPSGTIEIIIPGM